MSVWVRVVVGVWVCGVRVCGACGLYGVSRVGCACLFISLFLHDVTCLLIIKLGICIASCVAHTDSVHALKQMRAHRSQT